ncbi:ABC transporter ATP-binding protein [Abyssalbus ytuae]|uniref:ABC transporter ATP-binding protein n=1 Tax=Abyssalbus ytuae TaxID=2926907 RepID=A0A9E7D4T8_9FLAO|nr:ABC transporter ATP-binding protein [Abyssalbus ytuae]UOB19299.1 ABC transporter ATP-binding protein [Abyssalbus ytuae]
MLEIKNVSFGYNDNPVLKNISFKAAKGKHISIMGESGCGKSTLLKIIYGLLHIDEGEIFYNKKKLLGPNFNLVPGEDFMKYQAQDFDLMSFITVEENVGKYLSNFYRTEKKNRTLELLELVGMTDYAHIKPKHLSGGQQQRVALARALAKEPEVILLDEPFSSIDNFKKYKYRRDLFSYFKKENITCIVATHDMEDSLAFADEIIVLKRGLIIDRGTPRKLYKKPANKYVAALFDEANEIPACLFIPYENKFKTVIVYAHELKTVSNSALEVQVSKTYFKGSRYLHESFYSNGIIYFENKEEIKPGKKVFLNTNKTLLHKRLGITN